MDNLYPEINDPLFNIKISKSKEFYEQSMTFTRSDDTAAEADKKCFASFELSPHQQFVKNFLSVNTPYNSLLLFHGLGTGKTCSAIGVSEGMRVYMKQMNITKKIIVVAAPNVQSNFKQQLFDERKMKKSGGIWNISGCSGHNFISEINPVNLKGISKEKIVTQVERIINNYYSFMGYGEFANYISKTSTVSGEFSAEQKEIIKGRRLRKVFTNRLIIIDEVHNIRTNDDKKVKRVSSKLDELIKYVHPLRLLLLTATPMYNDPKEIIWLINLMNKNDGRSVLNSDEVFNKQGEFILNDEGINVGKELLIRKSIGYVSFVKGDNPYTFPYRIFPNDYKSGKSLKQIVYPTKSMFGGDILQPMEHLDLYCVGTGIYQNDVYSYIIETLKSTMNDTSISVENIERYGYMLLQKPLEALNMTYPVSGDLKEFPVKSLVGIEGISRTMQFKRNKTDYEYEPEIEEQFGRLFDPDIIGKYSAKIKQITRSVINSEGVCLIYSQYLDGGVIPLALALEELGCTRFDGPNLLKTPPKRKSSHVYTMITGNEDLSPNNALAVKKASETDNKNGDIIKIIIISRAGSEGLDFTVIRQVHILDPWYNTNRIEQTIGRAIRNCSHKMLPFNKRNTMIFLYATSNDSTFEAADMYVYRIAELKAILIGNVTRALKESAIDCLLNEEHQKSTAVTMDDKQKLSLSDGTTIEFNIGDKPFTQQCDYMESCSYICSPTTTLDEADISIDTYFIPKNELLVIKIKNFFKEHYFYKKDVLIKMIVYDKSYSNEQIDAVLDKIVNDKTEIVEDRYGRAGNIINIGDYYIFQPLELTDKRSSMFDRTRPIEFKHSKVIMENERPLSETIQNTVSTSNSDGIMDTLNENFDTAFNPDNTLNPNQKSWYVNAANAIVRLTDGGMSRSSLERFILSHIWDSTSSVNKLSVLNILFSKPSSSYTPFENKLMDIIHTYILKIESINGIYILEGNSPQLYILGNDIIWNKGKKTDIILFEPLFIKIISDKIKTLSTVYGFMTPFKDSNELIFKTKNKTEKRMRGARCDQASKKETIKTLNALLNTVSRNENCPSNEFDEAAVKAIGNIELCCYTELILRCYSDHRLLGNVWFIEPEYSHAILQHLK